MSLKVIGVLLGILSCNYNSSVYLILVSGLVNPPCKSNCLNLKINKHHILVLIIRTNFVISTKTDAPYKSLIATRYEIACKAYADYTFICTYIIHTSLHSTNTLSPASQILLRDAQVLPKLINCEADCKRDKW
jgi:hypothetical protein